MKPSIVDALPQHRCPLCGGPNACAPALSGRLDTPCWCKSVTFSPELLARVPKAMRGLSCLCQNCATQEVRPAEPDAD